MRRRLMVVAAALIGFTVVTGGQPAGTAVRLTLHEGTSMAAALSPDGRTIAIDLLGALWTMQREGGAATRILDDRLRRAACRRGRRTAGGSRFRRIAAARGASGPSTPTAPALQAGDVGPVRRPRAALVARRRTHRVLVRSQRQLRRVDADARDRRAAPAHDESRQRLHARVVAGRTRDRVRLRSTRRRGIYAIAVDAARRDASSTQRRRTVAAPSLESGRQDASPTPRSTARAQPSHGRRAPTSPIADEDVFPVPCAVDCRSGRRCCYTADGKIKRRPAAGGPARTIEFSADVSFTRRGVHAQAARASTAGAAAGARHHASGDLAGRVADRRSPRSAICGSMPVDGGDVDAAAPDHDAFVDTDPAWSPDGTTHRVSRPIATGRWTCGSATLQQRRGSQDSRRARCRRRGRRTARASRFSIRESQLQIVDVASGQVRQGARSPERAGTSELVARRPRDRDVARSRPYSTRFREGTNQVLRVLARRPGGRPLVQSRCRTSRSACARTSGPVWSPDGTQMAAIVDGHLAAFPVARDGAPTRSAAPAVDRPCRTRRRGRADSRRLLYQTADGLRLVDVDRRRASRDIAPRFSWTATTTTGIDRRCMPGRLFDGRSTTARENVDIVIEGNRIARVEPHRARSPQGHRRRRVERHRAAGPDRKPRAPDERLRRGARPHLAVVRHHERAQPGRQSVRGAWKIARRSSRARASVRASSRRASRSTARASTIPAARRSTAARRCREQLARAQKMGFDFIKTYVRLPDLLQKRVDRGGAPDGDAGDVARDLSGGGVRRRRRRAHPRHEPARLFAEDERARGGRTAT